MMYAVIRSVFTLDSGARVVVAKLKICSLFNSFLPVSHETHSFVSPSFKFKPQDKLMQTCNLIYYIFILTLIAIYNSLISSLTHQNFLQAFLKFCSMSTIYQLPRSNCRLRWASLKMLKHFLYHLHIS